MRGNFQWRGDMTGKDLRRGGLDRLTVEDILAPGFSTPWDAPTDPSLPLHLSQCRSADARLADKRVGGRATAAAATRADVRRGARPRVPDERCRLAWRLRREQFVGRLHAARHGHSRLLFAVSLSVVGRWRRAWPRGSRPAKETRRARPRNPRRPDGRPRQAKRDRRTDWNHADEAAAGQSSTA